MTLRYSIRKNRYHSFIKLMMPTSGTFTITVNGVRTVRLAPGEALLFDPTEDITYAAVKDTKGISLLVASNYFHARTRFQAALFKVLPILGKTARERCFLAVLRAVHDYLGDMTPEEAEDYCDTLSAALRPVLSESFSGNDKSFASHQDFLRACAVDAMYKHIADPRNPRGRHRARGRGFLPLSLGPLPEDGKLRHEPASRAAAGTRLNAAPGRRFTGLHDRRNREK